MSAKSINIPLSGLSTSPSDYSVPDGHLAAAIGVVHEDGEILPSSKNIPKVILDCYDDDDDVNYKVLHCHETSFYKHIILYCKIDEVSHYYWADMPIVAGGSVKYISKKHIDSIEGRDISKFVSIGNILVSVSSNDAIRLYWKDDDYVCLNDSLPDIEISFGLKPYFYQQSYPLNEGVYGGYPDYTKVEYDVIDHEKNYFEAISACTNKFTGEWCVEKKVFSQPFFVRYAYRLFDGSYVKQSAPILMTPSTGPNPLCTVDAIIEQMSYFNCFGIGCRLTYKVINNPDLSDWNDIIDGIEIFVSAPEYLYKQDTNKYHEEFGYINTNSVAPSCFYDLASSIKSVSEGKRTTLWDLFKNAQSNLDDDYNWSHAPFEKPGYITSSGNIYKMMNENGNFITYAEYDTQHKFKLINSGMYLPINVYHLEKKDSSSVNKMISEESIFYSIKFIEYDDIEHFIKEEYDDIKIEDGVLGDSLVSRNILTDDFDSHNIIIPEGAISYNNRVSYYNIKKKYFEGFPAEILSQRYNGDDDLMEVTPIVIIKDHKDKSIVKIGRSSYMSFNAEFPYLTYPDVAAKKIILFCKHNSEYFTISADLHEHKLLNCATYFSGNLATGPAKALSHSYELDSYKNMVSEDDLDQLPNYIYTSNVDNPFTFDKDNAESIGTGEILAMAPVTKALSEGQFGEFPMMCFTHDGVWALTISATGSWSSKQVISRDIISGSDLISQLDNMVVFVTSRGIMSVSGSQTACLTDVFNGSKDIFLSNNKDSIIDILSSVNVDLVEDEYISSDDINCHFRDYINSAIIIFDYAHQRIVIGNKESNISYVFSMTDRLWTQIPCHIVSSINCYPECYAMICNSYTGNNLFVDFSTDYIITKSSEPTDNIEDFVENTKEEIDDLNDQKEQKEYSIKNLKSQIIELKNENSKSNKDIEELKSRIVSLNKQYNDTYEELAYCIDICGVCYSNNEELQHDIDIISDLLDDEEHPLPSDQINEYEVQLRNLQRYSTIANKIGFLSESVLQSKKVQHESEIYNINNSIEELNSSISNNYLSISTLSSNIDDLIEELSVIINTIAEKVSSIAGFIGYGGTGNIKFMPSDGYILTRPIKLGAPDLLKTIRSINLRGVFSEESRVEAPVSGHKFGMILYGTNDPSLSTWNIVGSVRGPRMQFRYGSPYKAFRLSIISHMTEGESLSHIEVEYEVKETSKIR